MTSRFRSGTLLIATMVFSACGADPIGPSQAGITIVSGDGQVGRVGESLAENLVVEVTDHDGQPVDHTRNTDVTWTVISGQGGFSEIRDDSWNWQWETILVHSTTTRTGPGGLASKSFFPTGLGPVTVSVSSRSHEVEFKVDVGVQLVRIDGGAVWECTGLFATYPNCSSDVTVPVGVTVEWANDADVVHEVVSTSSPLGGRSFASGALQPNGRFRFVPRVPGVWDFVDPVSGGTGRLIAEGAPLEILFASDREEHRQIYAMAADGSGQTRLTSTPRDHVQPVWSPDGVEIAFVSGPQIYVTNPDSAVERPLTQTPVDFFSYGPAWAPDGTRIAFTLGDWWTSAVHLVDRDGSSPPTIVAGDADQPAWSPDGARIAFTSFRHGASELYVMDVDGSNQIRLTFHPASDQHPTWSPDGTEIAFASDRGGDYDIYVIAADGSDPVRLTSSPSRDASPTWSPDGTKIAFASDRDGNSEIYVMDADGGQLANVSNHPEWDGDPSWAR